MAKKKDEKSTLEEAMMPQVDAVIVTKDGLKALKAELKELSGEGRKRVASRLKEAISYGDLSENSEYEEAKNEQAFIEGRILSLEHMVKNAKVVDEKHHSKQVVEIGSKVTIKLGKEESEVNIVGSTESNPFESKISNESPLGMALLGSKKGAKVVVKSPGGEATYEILKLS
jgi:transcription elongation factor GreA